MWISTTKPGASEVLLPTSLELDEDGGRASDIEEDLLKRSSSFVKEARPFF